MTDIFLEYCSEGRYDEAKELYMIIPDINIHSNNEYAFIMACASGDEDFAKWLYNLGDVDIHAQNNKPMRYAIEERYINLAKWLYSLGDYTSATMVTFFSEQFIKVCESKDTDLFNWMINLPTLVDTSYCNYKAFCICIDRCMLQWAITIYELGDNKTKIELNHLSFLERAFIQNNLEMFQWLYETNIKRGTSYTAQDIESCFTSLCKEGFLELAQHVYNLIPINIHKHNEVYFRHACNRNRLDMVDWIYSLGDVNIHANYDEAFRIFCRDGNLENAKWLYSLGGVDINSHCDVSFHSACQNNKIDMALWLKSLDPDAYSLTIINNRIVDHQVIPIRSRILNALKNHNTDELARLLRCQKSESIVSENCYICRSECEGELLTKLSCNHIYCITCIATWAFEYDVSREYTCPYCTRDFTFATSSLVKFESNVDRDRKRKSHDDPVPTSNKRIYIEGE